MMFAMILERGTDTWAGVRRGDEPAFRDLFATYNKLVYNFAFRHTASWAAAEDATQACFATVWRRARDGSLPDLDGADPAAWLCGVVRNECRNAVRSSGRHLRVVRRVEAEPASSNDNVASWIDHEASMSRINEVLHRLPDGQRSVLEMVVWAGLGMAETAATLGVPVGTVKSRLARARQALATTEVAHLLGQES